MILHNEKDCSSTSVVRISRMNRLINWNCEMLLDLMQQIVARRSTRRASQSSQATKRAFPQVGNTNPLDEVKEIISLPDFDAAAAASQQDPASVEIPKEVVMQLHLIVSEICRMYNDNPFHVRST